MIDDKADSKLYPLKLSRLVLDKVWGGHKLARTFQRDLSPDLPIGEVWVVWRDLAVENGPLHGSKLQELVRDYPLSLLGSRSANSQDREFPLLVKLIDAQATLSVQVHPDDAYAQANEGEPFGKVEMWYFLDAEPGARLYHGAKEPLSRSDVMEAIEAGTLQEKLAQIEASPGDVVFNPPGTIHALGEGLVLYELQQSSDLTYRLYDWDRRDPNRPLHIEKSLDVVDLEPYARHKTIPVEIRETGGGRAYLCACRHFAAELLTVHSHLHEQPAGVSFHILTVLQGAGRVQYGANPSEEVSLGCGESLLVPASVHEYELHATQEEPLVAIKAYLPDLLQDIVVPLRREGIPDDTIVQLGGTRRHSDIGRLLETESK
jgi:mannose-6-phosphate isomerase